MLVPIVDMKEFEKVGFKKCQKPYDECMYMCFLKGVQYILISPKLVTINKWTSADPRLHEAANYRRLDKRTAQDFLCELILNKMVTCDYLAEKGEQND